MEKQVVGKIFGFLGWVAIEQEGMEDDAPLVWVDWRDLPTPVKELKWYLDKKLRVAVTEDNRLIRFEEVEENECKV